MALIFIFFKTNVFSFPGQPLPVEIKSEYRIFLYINSKKFCNICIHASFWNKLQELKGNWTDVHIYHMVWMQFPWIIVLIYGSLCVLVARLQQPRCGRSFSEELLCLKLVSVRSKNWQKGDLRWCNMVVSPLNARLLL